jgi:hypothetical protein
MYFKKVTTKYYFGKTKFYFDKNIISKNTNEDAFRKKPNEFAFRKKKYFDNLK